ncbi:hypothetical protein JCGZ_26645 [Jatropha curcas]|uniref:Uncharacterized protein n=1 Tax=Jatropha curcas TaxID=180498 RepID=A0A067JW85_JATCU|nr:hypothetical protein JCGZ_26645 [Jatropha curcas]
MGSTSDEEMATLAKLSEDEIVAANETEVEYKLVHPEPDIRANTPLDNDESMILYEKSLSFGVQFPLSVPLNSFFNEYRITISQLHPNGLRLVCGIAEMEPL